MKSVQISDELYAEVVKFADADHVPVDTLITALVSERLADWNRLEARASRGSLGLFNRVLAKVPAAEPDSLDRL